MRTATITNGQPAPAPCGDSPMTLLDIVRREANVFRAWGTVEGNFLAGEMERIARLLEWTGATTPQDHVERIAVWDEALQQSWFQDGYSAGLIASHQRAVRQACCCHLIEE
jgi:hypothetical protein